jgi:7-keto-8-aminopelargonate synthetase-like enzyme
MGVGVAVVAGGRAAGRWARRRCDEALASAHLMPASSERSFALIAGLEDRTADRAQVREQRAFQQALDAQRRGGAFLARRVTPTVPTGRRSRPGA